MQRYLTVAQSTALSDKTLAALRCSTAANPQLNTGIASGSRDLAVPLTRAAIAVGADGVMVDVHPEPEMALCDGAQALVESDMAEIAHSTRSLSAVMGCTLTSTL